MVNPFAEAFKLLVSFDYRLYSIVFTSLRISFASTLLSAMLSIPLGVFLGVKDFKGKKSIVAAMNSLMALPTVVIGLLVYSVLSRSGPLGGFGLLFSPRAMIIGQAVMSFPIVVSMIYGGLSKLDERFTETLFVLGAGAKDILIMAVKEARVAILSAVLGGFGRVIGEVGISMMLGGNIKDYTRTITTAIALETSKGEFSLAFGLGMVLMLIAFIVNFLLHRIVNYGK